MKVFIFIEADVVVRHFLHSGAFNDLGEKHQLTFIFPEIDNKRMGGIDPAELNLPGQFLHLRVNNKRVGLWKRLFQVSLFKLSLNLQARAVRRLYQSALGWKASLQYFFLALPGIFYIFERATRFFLNKHEYVELQTLLERERPDAIIHPCVMTGLYLNDLIDLCQGQKIPLTVIMNSWDNPSTKRAMVGNPDWLLVWGEQTQNHAIQYAKTPSNRVVRFGVAQFDVYRQPSSIAHSEFCALHDIDPTRIILLYAGSSKGSDEITHLTLLDDAIERGLLPNVTILYRPHPWGGGGRGGHLLLYKKWKNVRIESTMQQYLEDIRNGFSGKFLADYCNTRNVLSCVNAVISPLSTIILEAALLGRPVLCFLPLEDDAEHFKRDFALTHFHQLFDVPEVFVASGSSNLINSTQLMLKQIGDQGYSDQLKNAMAYFIEPFEQSYSYRLNEFIERNVAIDISTKEQDIR